MNDSKKNSEQKYLKKKNSSITTISLSVYVHRGSLNIKQQDTEMRA